MLVKLALAFFVRRDYNVAILKKVHYGTWEEILMKNKGAKSKGSKKRVALIILCVVLALILIALILGTAYVEHLLSLINRSDDIPTVPANTAETVAITPPDPTATLSSTPAEVVVSEGTVNILLMGTDLSNARSDTVILCTINKAAKTITLASFMRDTYVDIPGYFPHKLNTAYGLGGFSTVNDVLETNFGIQVDGNVAINFENFIKVVDLIGGIEIELTQEEADYMMYTVWNGLDSSGWDLSEGVQMLNGDQALAYSRIRAVQDSEAHDGDFGRTNRQRIVLSKMLDRIRGLSIGELNDLLTEILPMVTTDLSNSEIVNYTLDLFPILLDSSIVTQQIPAEGTYYLDWVEQDGGMSIIRVSDWDANCDILKDIVIH